jgi:hypothetical protein
MSNVKLICNKDAVSVVCIILRHIDTESIDYDTLLFCYLKVCALLYLRLRERFIAVPLGGQSGNQL